MPSEDQIKATGLSMMRRFLEAMEGRWDDGGPDHDGLTGKPHKQVLDSVTQKLMIALGNTTTIDTLTGDPSLLVDRLIAERDALALDKASRDGLIADLQAEVARLRAPLSPESEHNVEILSESATEDGTCIKIQCSYSGCTFGTTLHLSGDAPGFEMVDMLARAHYEDMEEEAADGKG